MDKQELLRNLRDEYDELNHKCKALYSYINSLDFPVNVPNSIERVLLNDQLTAMEGYRKNLLLRIKFYKENEMNKLSGIVGANPAETERHHCGQDVTVTQEGVFDLSTEEGLKAFEEDLRKHLNGGVFYPNGVPEKGSCPVDDGSAADDDDLPESIKELEGMMVVKFVRGTDTKCEGCPHDHYGTDCRKVELVGGHFLCLAPLPNSVVTE